MYKEELQKKIDEMTKIYKIIHRLVFKYGIFAIAICFGIYVARNVTNTTTNILKITNNDTNQKLVTIKWFKKWLTEIRSSGDLIVYVGLGHLELSGWYLSTYNNMVSYNGFILPRYFAGDVSLFSNKKQFEESDFNNEKMNTFLTNFLNITNKEDISTKENTPIPLNGDIVTTFNLQCLSQTKIYNGLCDIFTRNFIDTFLLYNISEDIAWFKTIFNTLKSNDEYKDTICKNLIMHSYYTNNTSEDIKSVVKMCWSSDYDSFNKFALFSEIQKELESKNISKLIYSDKIANAYKTHSFIQIIYEDINNKRVSISRISNYLTFIEELLKKDELEAMETNSIYYFNNYKLKPILEDPELSMKMGSKTDISTLIKRINTINNWDSFMGYEGLKYLVNENILVEKAIEGTWDTIENYETTIEKLLGQISSFSVEEKVISGNQILTKGNLNISTKGLEISLPIKIQFEEQSSILYIKRIDITWEPDISKAINWLVSEEQRSFADLQKYITANINLFIAGQGTENKNEKNFCDIAAEAFPDTTEGSGSLIGSWQGALEKCDENGLTVSRIRNEKKIEITVSYKNYSFKGISSPYENAQAKINEYVKDPKIIWKYASINESNMINFVKDVLKIFDTAQDIGKPQTEFEASDNTLIVVERVKKYLKTNVTDIVEKGDKIIIAFTMSWINLIGNYNIKTHTLDQLYFKDITQNGIPVLIKKTQISLNDENKEEISKFMTNPILYFKEKSVENYLLYLEKK